MCKGRFTLNVKKLMLSTFINNLLLHACTQTRARAHTHTHTHTHTRLSFQNGDILRTRYIEHSLETNLLTSCSRTLLQLVNKFHAFYGTRRLITAFTTDRHVSLFSSSSIQSRHPHSASWKSIIILLSHLRLGLPSVLFPSGFPAKTLYTPIPSPKRVICPAHLIVLDLITRIILGEEYRSLSYSLCSCLHSPVT